MKQILYMKSVVEFHKHSVEPRKPDTKEELDSNWKHSKFSNTNPKSAQWLLLGVQIGKYLQEGMREALGEAGKVLLLVVDTGHTDMVKLQKYTSYTLTSYDIVSMVIKIRLM